MPDKTLGEVLHEARMAGGEQRPRPMPVEDWADRDPRLKALDEAMAAAVEAVVMERRETADKAKLAEVGQTIANFQAHYGHSELPMFKVANDLAEGIRQVLDRVPLGGDEGGGEDV